MLSQAFHLPLGLTQLGSDELGVTATARALGNGDYEVTAQAARFALRGRGRRAGLRAERQLLPPRPGEPHRFTLARVEGTGALRAKLRPLNASKPTQVQVAPAGAASP